MSDWFEQSQQYHEMMKRITNDEFQLLKKKNLWKTFLITLSVGIAVNGLYGMLSSDPSNAWKGVILAIGSAAGAASISMFVADSSLIKMIGKCNEANRFGTELQFPMRVESTLVPHHILIFG